MHVLSLQEQSRKHSMPRHGESLPSSSSNFLQITNAKTSAVPMTPSTDPSTAATSLTNEPRDAATGGPPAQRLDATILYTPSVASITPSLFWSLAGHRGGPGASHEHSGRGVVVAAAWRRLHDGPKCRVVGIEVPMYISI